MVISGIIMFMIVFTPSLSQFVFNLKKKEKTKFKYKRLYVTCRGLGRIWATGCVTLFVYIG